MSNKLYFKYPKIDNQDFKFDNEKAYRDDLNNIQKKYNLKNIDSIDKLNQQIKIEENIFEQIKPKNQQNSEEKLYITQEFAQKVLFMQDSKCIYIQENQQGLLLLCSILTINDQLFNLIYQNIVKSQKLQFEDTEQAIKIISLLNCKQKDSETDDMILEEMLGFTECYQSITNILMVLGQNQVDIFNNQYQNLLIKIHYSNIIDIIKGQIQISLQNGKLRTENDYKNMVKFILAKQNKESIYEDQILEIQKYVEDELENIQQSQEQVKEEYSKVRDQFKQKQYEHVVKYLVSLGKVNSQESYSTTEPDLLKLIQDTLDEIPQNTLQMLVNKYKTEIEQQQQL